MTYKSKNEYTHQDINLIATYEELMHVPHDQKVTYYFGDYGSHFFERGVTDEQIHDTYEKALAAIEMTEDEFTSRHDEFFYRGDIIQTMWDRQLAKILQAGEKVWFVPTELDASGTARLQYGTVESVDAETETCTIRSGATTTEGVPLHYILGRWNEDITGTHYGQSKVEPFFYENLSMYYHYRYEVGEQWRPVQPQDPMPKDDPAPSQAM